MQITLTLPPNLIAELSAVLLASVRNELNAVSNAAAVTADADVLLTVKEAAEKLKMCQKTVLAKIEAGKLNAANMGTRERPQLRVSNADLQAYYQANRK